MLEISNELFRTQMMTDVICILTVVIMFVQQKFMVTGIHWSLAVTKYYRCYIYVSIFMYVKLNVCLWIKQFLLWDKNSLYK